MYLKHEQEKQGGGGGGWGFVMSQAAQLYLALEGLLFFLFTASHADSSFDVVLSGVVFPTLLIHSLDFLAEIARILKPNGQLTLKEPTGNPV